MLCQAILSSMVEKKEEQEKEIEESEEELEKESSQDSDEEEFEGIDESRFSEFLSSSESFSPSLGQVGVSHELRATDLEQDLSNVAGIEDNKKEENDPFKYKIGSDLREGPKYITSETEIEKTTMPSHVDLMSLGKEQQFLPKEIGFSASPSSQIGGENPGKYELPDKVDMDKAGKKDIFKKPEIKYEPSKEY